MGIVSPGDIGNIRSLALDYARPNKYVVQIFIGSTNVPLSNLLTDEVLSLSCSSAVFPGKRFATSADKRGSPYKTNMPHDIEHSAATFSFQVGSLHLERSAIEEWMNFIYDSKTESFAFFNDYVTDIHVIQFDQARNPIKHVRLIDAYPIAMSEIALSYEMNDQITTFTTSFTFSRFEEYSVLSAAGDVINNFATPLGG